MSNQPGTKANGAGSNQKTAQQQRAAAAWADIKSVQKSQKEYGSLVRGFPAMVQGDGLGAALAFLLAKAKGDNQSYHHVLYTHISNWVMKRLVRQQGDLLRWLTEQNSAMYRHAATEALAYTAWLKRFAEAEGWTE